RVPVLGRDGGQLVGDQAAQDVFGSQNFFEMLDLGPQLVPLRLEVDLRELRQAAQAQLEDVLGLHLGEVEDLHQAGAGGLRVVALAHDLDDLVDVEDRQQQALDQVQARPAL